MLQFEQSSVEVFPVHNWGTFDVPNYGDLLFPLILEAELKKRLSATELRLYSPQGGWFEPQKTRWVERIRRFENTGCFSEIINCRGIILGGGDIIRFDNRSMAQVYGISSEQSEKERSYSVFIEDLGRIARWVPVLWNAVGVPFEFNEQQALSLRENLRHITYISVRDEFSKKKLVEAGIQQEIYIVPDTAFLVARHYPKETLTQPKEILVQTEQFPISGKVLCFQVSSAATAYVNELADALNKLIEIDRELQIVFLPIGICHADTSALKNIQKQIDKRTFLVNETTDLQTIASVIAHSDYFTGSSLHGNITAYAYGIPHLFLDFSNLAKIRGCANLMGREQWVITQASMLLSSLSKLIQQPKNWDRPLPQLIQQIDSHFDRCVELLQQQSSQLLPREAALNFVEESHEALRFVLRNEQAQLQKTQAELVETQSHLQQTQAELVGTQSHLQQTQAELVGTQSHLQQMQAELVRSQFQVQQLQAEVRQTQTEVQQTQTELEQSQSQVQQLQLKLKRSQNLVDAMESSKFWQLRSSWFKFKQAIGLTNTKTAKALVKNVIIPEVSDFREITFKIIPHNSSSGVFESINGSRPAIVEIAKSNSITANGWAILPDESRAADSVIITYGKDNTIVGVAPVNLERPDVARALNDPAYKRSGWSIQLEPASLPNGKVRLKAWAYNSATKEAIYLNYSKSKSQAKNSAQRLRYAYNILKVKGMRYALAKVANKVSARFNDSPLAADLLPTVFHRQDPYQIWMSKHFPKEADLQKMTETINLLDYKPLISIIVPVYNPPEKFLREAIESVINQVYPYWELCLADDASTQPYVRQVLKEYATKDSRIKVVFREENGHISRASNSAIEVATGEFITLLDHDDLLTPDALYEVAFLLNKHPDADMIYSDEDKVSDRDRFRDPYFKPDWCPDSFLSRMYTCHLGTYRRSLVNEIGRFRVGYEGSQDYDLVLRLTEKTEKIFHIPKILYHWRVHPASTASSLDSKTYALDAARKALAEALERRGEPGKVIPAPGNPEFFVIRYDIKQQDLVSIIIPTKNLGSVLDKCLASIFEKTIYENYEIILIDNGSTEQNTLDILNKWKIKEPQRFKCYELDIPFNYARINNFAVENSQGKYLLFLNNDTEVLDSEWLQAMVEQAQRPSIAAVGALLLYPDNTIQHAGVVAGIGGVAGHSHKHFIYGSPSYFSHVNTVNNYSAVTGACLMCRRDVFEAVGGFNEDLAVAFNDVDLCFKFVEKGYRNIYLPHVVLYHYESKSRGKEDTPEKLARFAKEIEYMQNKWKDIIEKDPCYNPNLTRQHEDYRIEI